ARGPGGPLAVFEPALRRPFKVLGKCEKASCEVRQGK
ncbi:MAG: hypothetical protein JWR71_1897, partial [Pseudarthrobacter sp.]|nr:hypothetical protein [Pseudarthrobacter sp.]